MRLKQKTPIVSTVPEIKDKLYVVLPYFNYCKYANRKKLFLEFIDRMATNENIHLIVSEAKLEGKTVYDLPHGMKGVFAHFRFEVDDAIWVKENLINLAIERLPKDWKYVAWVDADLTFLNEKWAEETLASLKGGKDVLQMFQTCVNMGPDGEATKLDNGFIYMHQTSGKSYTKTYKYGFWHPGYCAAYTRRAYVAMDGLIDWGILGSGDHHMALAFIGKADQSHPGGLTENYKKRLLTFEENVANAKLELGYIKGTIVHHYHGDLANRKYRERWSILVDGSYDPEVDIEKTKLGVLRLTSKGKRLAKDIQEYFEGRREDN